MDVQEWLDRNGDKLQTEYERLFVTEVLSQIAEIEMAAVQAQYPFKDRLNRQRYADFVLVEGDDAIRIAIEIDGYDKRGKGGMNMGEWLDWLWRQNGLSQEGWVVLRFANVDVRDRPSRCAEHLRLLLREERSKAGVVGNLQRQSEDLRKKILELNRTARKGIRQIADKAASYRTQAEKAEALRLEDQAKIEKLEKKLQTLEHQAKVAAHAKKLDSEEESRLEALNEEQSISISDVLAMKFSIIAISFLLVCAMVLIAFLVVNRPDASSSVAPVTAPAPERIAEIAVGETCDNPAIWRDALRLRGQTVAIAGPVAAVTYREDVRGRPTWIDIGGSFPDRDRLVLVIWGDDQAALSSTVGRVRPGQTVCAHGLVGEYRGVSQIEISSPNQMRLH